MSYPDEIVESLAAKYNLDDALKQQLRDTLSLPGIQEIVESGYLTSEDFLKKADHDASISIIFPVHSARNIATVFPLLSAQHLHILKPWTQIVLDICILNSLPAGKLQLKRQLAFTISTQLLPITIALVGYPALLIEYQSIAERLPQYVNMLQEPIQEAAKNYFTEFFSHANKIIRDIRFTLKRGGIQLGTTMTLKYEDENKQENSITYFIKTHQHGSTSEVSSVKPVDPKELFIYKVLEYIGYAPKTHFFYNPLAASGFYVATQDMAFTKTPQIKIKKFTLFDVVSKQYDATADNLAHDPARRAMIALDMLARVLRLQDTTTNPGNFGFTVVDHVKTKWKFLDFRIFSEPNVRYLRREIFEDFCAGNGTLNYDYAKFFMDIFTNPDQQIRKINMAYGIIQELCLGKPRQSREGKKMSLPDAIERSFHEIQKYIQQHSERLRLNPETSLQDLEFYQKAVLENFKTLRDGVCEAYQLSNPATQQLPSF